MRNGDCGWLTGLYKKDEEILYKNKKTHFIEVGF